LDHHIEGAKLTAVTPKNVFDVKGRRAKSVRDIRDLGGCHEQKDRRRIDEAANEPRQATRSIFGRARVTQTVRPCLSGSGT
jgi:hypothetical protein